jgi:hypothetical protein
MIETQTIPPFPGGMNVEQKPWAIEDDQARYLQDAILDEPMVLKRRGPIRTATNSAAAAFSTAIANAGIGIVSAISPGDVFRIAVLNGTASAGSAKLSVFDTNYTTVQTSDWGAAGHINTFDPAKRYNYLASPHPWGGTLIGTQIGSANPGGANTTLGHWYGATKPEVSAGTITVVQDSTAVIGVGTTFTNIDEGSFLYAIADTDNTPSNSARTFIGTVRSIADATHLTLMDGALFDVTGRSYKIRPVRPLSRRVATGQITATTTSATVNGSNTKFKRQKLDTPSNNGHWCLFRADDMKFIGKVSSVASDIQLTLTANAAIVCNKDKFVAIDMYDNKDLNVNSTNEGGYLTAQFAGRQWYGNRPAGTSNKSQPYANSRVWFSDIYDPEAIDVTSDGDHLLIPSQRPPIKPLTGLMATTSALVCFKEDETYGVFGTDETNFTVRKILDDGAFSPMAAKPWNGGVVWAGQKGIWFFDGSEEPFNLIEDRMLTFWKKAVDKHKSTTYKVWSMIHRDHYFVYVENASPPFGPIKGTGASPTDTGTPTKYLALVINLNTRAISTLTNFAFLGSVTAPLEDATDSSTLFLVNKTNPTTPWALQGARVCSAEALFTDNTNIDTHFTAVVSPVDNAMGPDLYIESKRYDMSDPQRKKNFKQLQMLYRLDSFTGTYVVSGDTTSADFLNNYLNLGIIKGLNEYASVSSSKWRLTRVTDSGSGQAGFGSKRIKFLKRSQHIGFRIWQQNISDTKVIQIGPMAIGYKWLRPGRV